MDNSILNDIRKLLGISDPSYDYFDNDLIVIINGVFSTLAQLGVGPIEGFTISSGDEVWCDFLSSGYNLEMVKTYIYLKTRMVFDPPSSASVLEAFKSQIAELEWRINSQVDYEW